MIIKISKIISDITPSDALVKSANINDPVTVEALGDGTFKVVEGAEILEKAKLLNRITVMTKEAKITSIEERTKSKLYRQTHKAQLDIKAKKLKAKQKAGIVSKKKRIGTAAGGYTFIDMGSQPKTMHVDPSMKPVEYHPLGKFPTVKLASGKYYYASSAETENLRQGLYAYKNPIAALMLAVNWSPDDLLEPPPFMKLPYILEFIDSYHEPADHPVYLYELEDPEVVEALMDYSVGLKKTCKLKLISQYPSWKSILTSEDGLKLI